MPLSDFPTKADKFEIQKYKKPKDVYSLKATNVAFTGSPRKHPNNPKVLILVRDPYSTNTSYYEFKMEDIAYMEEQPKLVNLDGETVNMIRIWVKKDSVALRCTPFIVADTGIR
jgi:inorganic pyrophosphatase